MHTAMFLLFLSLLLFASAAVPGEDVPIIDLRKPEHEIVQEVGKAAEELGFFQVINHRYFSSTLKPASYYHGVVHELDPNHLFSTVGLVNRCVRLLQLRKWVVVALCCINRHITDSLTYAL
jgi:hypothetical protein